MIFAKCVDMGAEGHEAFVGDHAQDFLNAEVREEEQLFAAPPEEDGNRNIFGTGGVSCGSKRTTQCLTRMESASTDRYWGDCYGWIAFASKTRFVNSPHVGAATSRDEAHVKRLVRYKVGNPLFNKIEGCTWDLLGASGTPAASVLVMTDADWGWRRQRSFGATLGKLCGSRVLRWQMWYPAYGSSKKHDMVGVSEFWRVRVDGSRGWCVRGNCHARPLVQNVCLQGQCDRLVC